LAVGLSDDDEALLEQALDDRSGAVRAVAARLLDRLPHSARAARMADRARQMVAVAPDDQGLDRLDIGLVAPGPAHWRRDGVTADAPSGTSLGVAALVQVVAATPLAAWSALATPDHLLLLAREHELGSVLVEAWTRAAAAQRESTWAHLLLDE